MSVHALSKEDNALGGLTADIRRYADLAIAPSTRRAYSVGQRRFMKFCHLHCLEPLPATDLTLSSFAAFLTRSVKPGTCNQGVSVGSRISTATSASLCGIPQWTIWAMGRWKSDCVRASLHPHGPSNLSPSSVSTLGCRQTDTLEHFIDLGM